MPVLLTIAKRQPRILALSLSAVAPTCRLSAVSRDCGPPLGGHASAAQSCTAGERPAAHHAAAGRGEVWTHSAWSGCHTQGLRIFSKTTRGARPTRGDRMVSRHAVAVASRSRPPCLGRVISTTGAGPETRSGPALPKHSRTRWGTTTLKAVGGGPCQGGGVAGGHHHARSCRWWALFREGMSREGTTTLAAVGGGPCSGRGCGGGPRKFLAPVRLPL